MQSRRALPFVLLVFSLTSQAPGGAAEVKPGTASYADLFHSSAVTLTSENDKYFAGTDHHYTNGLKLTFLGTTRLDESPGFIRWITRQVPTLRQDAARQYYKVGVALGQDIFTPSDTTTATPDPRDRPYAAWLHTSINFQAVSADGKVLRVAELTVGMVGPAAFGRQVQNGIHRMLGDETSQGWDHQLRNEPGLILGLQFAYIQNYRTNEFYGQVKPDVFGSVSMSVLF